MGLTKEQLKERSIQKLKDFVKEYGTVITKSLTVWDKYPVCVKDICVLSVCLFNDRIVFGDFDREKKEMDFVRKTTDDLDKKYIDEVLTDMMEIQSKKK